MNYEITSPDGNRFVVTAPEGATQDQVLAYAQGQFKQPSFTDRAKSAVSAVGDYYKNVNMGLLRGAARIGDTLRSIPMPANMVMDAALGPSDKSKVEGFFKENADPSSIAFQGGDLASQVAGTAGIGGVLAKGATAAGQAIPMLSNVAPKVATALETGGMRIGAPAATTAGRVGDTAIRMGAGAVTGGAMTGLVNPEDAALGAAVGGALPPAVAVAGAAGRGIGALVEPFYQSGRDRIIGRTINSAIGPTAPQVQQRLANAPTLVPGSVPTAAEAGGSAGLAALQRAASAVDPESYAFRAAQNNEARVAALQDLAGTTGQREFFAANRDATAQQLYRQAYDKGVDITRNPTTGQFLPKAEIAGVKGEITKLLQRPSIQEAMDRARKLAADEGINLTDASGSIQGLDYVKRGLDDMIKKSDGNEARVLINLKNRLLTTLDRLSPDYAQARTTFSQMSRPINQMDVAQTIADRSIRPLDQVINPNQFARALSDDTVQSVTGMRNATLENTLEPQQLALLTAIREDLARNVASQNLGRGAGSDTLQKLSMTNLMQRSGVPLGVLNAPMIGRLGNFAYQTADERLRQQLAMTLLNSPETARLMGLIPAVQSQPVTGLLSAPVTRSLLLNAANP